MAKIKRDVYVRLKVRIEADSEADYDVALFRISDAIRQTGTVLGSGGEQAAWYDCQQQSLDEIQITEINGDEQV